MSSFSRHFLRRPYIKTQVFYGPSSIKRQLATSFGAQSRASRASLRPYQEECIQAVLSHLNQGHKRLGISLATGSGKTVIFTHLIDRILPKDAVATQTLILVHRRELVEQAARHCQDLYPSKPVEVEMGNLHATGTADITVASVKSITSGERLQKFDPQRFKLILVDEAHHIVATTYLKVLEHFGLRTLVDESPALVGVSATLSRFDGLKLGAALDHVVYHKDYVDMIEQKWLTDALFTTVDTKADLQKVKSAKSGDFLASSLSEVINTPRINNITVRAWDARARERKSTLVFCVDVAHVQALTAAFREHGVDARSIVGRDHIRDRVQTLDAFKRQEFPVLLNCAIFTEGTDIPNIDCILLARPTKSRNLLVQMIGRGMRLFPSKKNCHIIDLVSSLGTGIVSTPTLFGLDPAELLNEATTSDISKIRAKKRDYPTQSSNDNASDSPVDDNPASLTFTDYDSVQDLIEDTSGERHVRAMSQFAWVQVDEDRYILTGEDSSYLAISKTEDDEFHVLYYAKLRARNNQGEKKLAPYARPRELATLPTLSEALRSADTFAKNTFAWGFISTSQPWRKAPASERQLEMLNKSRDEDEMLTGDDITKGKAMDMITKIKFGAKGRFDRIKVANRKKEKLEEKFTKSRLLWKREEVRVGRLVNWLVDGKNV